MMGTGSLAVGGLRRPFDKISHNSSLLLQDFSIFTLIYFQFFKFSRMETISFKIAFLS